MELPLIAQQFGDQTGAALRSRLARHLIIDAAPGPEGWSHDTEVLLAAPTQAWRGKPRPRGWPGATRWVQLPGTGIDAYPEWMFDVPCVTTAAGLNAPFIAEFVMATMLGFEKRFPEAWIKAADDWKPRMSGTLHGKRLALAGVGAVGTAVARHALGFGMHVVALRRTLAAPMDGVQAVIDPMRLAPMADHLVLCMPSTPQTRHVVNEAFLAACRPGLHVVNVARGDLIDQEALLRGLDDGTVARASLDVATPEPLPDKHPLYTHPKVRLTPHLAWSAPGAVDKLLDFFVGQLGLFITGQPLKNRVPPPLSHPI